MNLGPDRSAAPAPPPPPSFGHTPRLSSRAVDGAAARARRTRAVGAGVSLALHAAALSWLGLHVAPALRTPPPEDVPLTVELVRPPPLRRVAPSAPAPRTAVVAPPRETVVLPRPRPPAPRPVEVAPKPLPLPPLPAATGRGRGATAAGAPAGPLGARPAPGPLPAQEAQGDLRGFLRGTVGCSHEEYLHLTPAERARCDAGFATAARTAPPIPLPDDKLAGFARAADANARRRARREGSLENTLPPCDPSMVGSNLGVSCLPPQAHTGVLKF